MIIQEYHFSKDPNHHWPQRKRERVDELFDVELPDDFYTPEDDRDSVKSKLLNAIKASVDKRITLFLHDSDVEPEKYNLTVLAIVEILRNGKSYKPVLRAMSTSGEDTSESSGNSYVAITKGDTLYTLLLLPDSKAEKGELIGRGMRHARKNNPTATTEDIAVSFKPNAVLKISADALLKPKADEPVGRITNPSQLPYKVRGDYRNSQPNQPSTFEHKDYGKGKIIASDPGMKSTGVWDSITVQFPGFPQPKTFKKLYTTTYFRSLVTAESYVRLLEKLSGKSVILV